MRLAILDGFRGYFLLFMAVVHINGIVQVPLGRWNHHQLGWVEDAQGFVFISGFVVGLVYGGRFLKRGAEAMRRGILDRMWTIWTYHAGLVLAILAEGESYGYAILKRVRVLSGGELEWTDGMLYPLLHRLRRLGYVTTDWRTPAEGRRRRYYTLTDDGRAALAEQRRQWLAVTRALDHVWPGPGALLTALHEA